MSGMLRSAHLLVSVVIVLGVACAEPSKPVGATDTPRPTAPPASAPATPPPPPKPTPFDLDARFRPDAPLEWKLELYDPGSVATLERSAERPAFVRIAIERAQRPTPFNIQLNLAGLGVKAGTPYQLTFRVRADRPRAINYAMSMAHDPWLSLGFYTVRQVSTDWQDVTETFTLTSTDENARLHFDLGSNAASVELDQVVLKPAPPSASAAPAATAPPKP